MLGRSILTECCCLVAIHCDHNVTIISEQHNAKDPKELDRLIKDHPDDPDVALRSRVKGQVAVTRGECA